MNLAIASKAVIIGFNVRADARRAQAAEGNGVDIRYYNIIYDAVDEVKAAMPACWRPSSAKRRDRQAEVRTGVRDLEGRHGRRLLWSSTGSCAAARKCA